MKGNQNFIQCLSDIRPVEIKGTFVTGADGSVSSYTGAGITSVAEASTGKYTITLKDPWMKIRNFTLKAVNTAVVFGVWQFITTTYESDARGSTPVVKIGYSTASAGDFTQPIAGTYVFTIEVEDSNQS